MTGPADPPERTLATAFTPPGDLYVCPTAGVRLRARATRRRAELTLHTVAGCLLVVTLVALTGTAVLRGQRTDTGTPSQALLYHGAPPPAVGPYGVMPVLPWDARSANLIGASYGPSTLTHPLEVVPATPIAAASCPSIAGLSIARSSAARPELGGPCYVLTEPAAFVVSRLVAVDMTSQDGVAGVTLTLSDADGSRLRVFTERNMGSQVAFVVSGRVWWAAQIGEPVTTGVIQIADARSEATALDLVRSLGPRTIRKPPVDDE
ncbi:MAG: hypothetical protein V7637_5948 [Mycobacteriales bacterium]|jgi:hypothetical protein